MAWWRHFDLYFSRARVFPRPQDSRRDRRKLVMFLSAWLLLDSCSYAHEDHWFEAEEQAWQIVSRDSLLSVVSILVWECLVNRGVSNFPFWYLPNLYIMYIPQFNLVKAFRKYRSKLSLHPTSRKMRPNMIKLTASLSLSLILQTWFVMRFSSRQLGSGFCKQYFHAFQPRYH